MVTVKPSNYLNEYYGLSTDTKPTFEKMPNGSIFYEMDTGNIYMWDEENHEWFQQYDGSEDDREPVSINIDKTLSNEGAAADAKATGDAIADVKSTISFFDDIPGTVQTVNFDANGNPSSIVHTANGEAVRTDSFTWGDNTVTEKRELADGSYITFVTDLTTLVTTISEIQEA